MPLDLLYVFFFVFLGMYSSKGRIIGLCVKQLPMPWHWHGCKTSDLCSQLVGFLAPCFLLKIGNMNFKLRAPLWESIVHLYINRGETASPISACSHACNGHNWTRPKILACSVMSKSLQELLYKKLCLRP